MLIISDTENLVEQVKKGALSSIGAKDKIVCFNKGGAMIDVDFITIATQLKSPLLIVPGELNPVSAAYVIGSEKVSDVKFLTNQDTTKIVEGITLVTARTGSGISFDTKIRISREQGEKKRTRTVKQDNKKPAVESEEPAKEKKEQPDSPVESKEMPATVNEESVTRSEMSERILNMCKESGNDTLIKLTETNDGLERFKKAILDASDINIGFPMLLGTYLGKANVPIIKEAADKIYHAIKPNAR